MTQDEIIEMAKEASFTNHSTFEKCLVCNPDSLLHFANLVAAKEQKKWQDQTEVEIHEAVLEEREACAKLVDYWEGREGEHADAIRARGEQALAQPKQDGDCKKCTDGCPACDARKLQKEAHDLL